MARPRPRIRAELDSISMADERPKTDQIYARYQALAEAYEREPTLANYIKFSRTLGGSIARPIEIDPFSIEMELRLFGIDPRLVSEALDGDESKINELALRLMEALVKRKKLEKSGAHLQSRRMAISDSLIDYLVVAALEATEEHDVPLSSALVRLIRERLCGVNPDRQNEFLRMQRRRDAIALASLKFPSGEVSIRRIAALMKVEPSTISRWFPDGDFQQHVDRFRKSIDALGLRKKHTDG
jgi:hypothetical protein